MLGTLIDRALRHVNPPSTHWADELAGPVSEGAVPELMNESAATLYRHAPLGLASSALMAVLMMLAIDLVSPGKASWAWLMVCLLVLGVRLAHALHWRSAAAPPPAKVLVQQYAIGVGASAMLWAALPWISYAALDSTRDRKSVV